MFSLVSALMLALSYVAIAAPLAPVELLAWSPTITCPAAGARWGRGSVQIVSWKTDNIPEEKQNSTGILMLGYLENKSENLDIKNPLAFDFPISSGSVSFTVPQNTSARSNAIVVLIGDSGNASPQFTIF
ncbi:hypothetical protein K503DRAFT_800197 [Rhizopogon vinicolor AM-OR11-026]|uniref:Uncharacterized protein n=1 Tax=Rhizopogon vinicolor AM-OR11-026 TaxID=1314800 RepID=A0A1B7N1P4_9AGAM|nr:hypothetical protein K503DRAFT_800197 [Rhizopogon vinicolor AM-OR11-026]